MHGHAALGLDEAVADARVGEGPTDHDLVIAPSRSIGVELGDRYAALLQPDAGRARGPDRPGGRDVVGGDAVAEDRQNPRAGDVGQRLRLGSHPLEKRRSLHIRRPLIPGVALPRRDLEGSPLVVTGGGVGVLGAEHLGADGLLEDLGDLLGRGPEVRQGDGAAVGGDTERF